MMRAVYSAQHTHIDVGVLTDFTINFMTYENRKVSVWAETEASRRNSPFIRMNTYTKRKMITAEQ